MSKEEEKFNEAESRWNEDGTFEIREVFNEDEEDKKQSGILEYSNILSNIDITNEPEISNFDEIDETEEEIELRKEREYQKKVREHPDYLAKKKAIEEKLIMFSGNIIEEEKKKSTENNSFTIEERGYEENQPLRGIKERNIDNVAETKEQDVKEPKKKMSKFKMRQMQMKNQ